MFRFSTVSILIIIVTAIICITGCQQKPVGTGTQMATTALDPEYTSRQQWMFGIHLPSEVEAEKPFYVRSDEEQSQISDKCERQLSVLRKEANQALAGCQLACFYGQASSLVLDVPAGKKAILVLCKEAPTRLRLTDNRGDMIQSQASGLPAAFLTRGLLLYSPRGASSRRFTVKAILDMGHPDVPPLEAVGDVWLYYK